MKLTTVILIASLVQVSAASFGQKMTLRGNSVTFEKVFREISKQTGYDVLVSTTKFSTGKKISVNFSGASLAEVMDKVLQGTRLSYSIENKIIVINEKEPSLFDRVIGALNITDINGRVLDEQGKPLPGATVSVKGTGKRAVTNGN
ncbi:MAG TPA: STN and carboxypeptidase regulatory-like domain-containing protein [Pedobacter sp.]